MRRTSHITVSPLRIAPAKKARGQTPGIGLAMMARLATPLASRTTQHPKTIMSIIWTILIGFVAGLIARAIKPGNDGMGIILTTVLGIVGALIATYVGQAMGWYQVGQPAGFIASVIGAIVLLFVIGLIRKKS